MDYNSGTIDIQNVVSNADSEHYEKVIIALEYNLDEVEWMVVPELKIVL